MERETVSRALRACLEQGKDIILIPNGKYTAMAREILLEEHGQVPRFIADNYHFDGKTVYSVDGLPPEAGDCVFLITTGFDNVARDIRRQLLRFVPKEQILTVLDFEPDWLEVLNSSDKVSLDFLSVGFPKCMTTSVYALLLQNPNLFLLSSKESMFLSEKLTLARHDDYKKMHAPALGTNRLVGDMETTYCFIPDRVHAYYGDNLRLLFFFRDPVKALFSSFKMAVRDVFDPETIALFREYGRVCPEMFDHWAQQNRKNYCYSESLRQYRMYYPREAIHTVLGEDLIADTDGEMFRLQRFIGLAEDQCRSYSRLPRVNTGELVSRDLLCAIANHQINDILANLSGDDMLRARFFNELRPQLRQHTLIEYKESPFPETQKSLREYYRDDIGQLEEFLGRSLKGLWY